MKSPLAMVLVAACTCLLSTRSPAAVGFGDPQIQSSPSLPAVDGVTVTLISQDQPDSGFALYQWFKDGVSLSNGGRVSGATTNKLVLKGIQKADEGAYRIQVREVLPGGGVDAPVLSDPIDLTVIVRPSITSQPVAPSAPIAQDGTFTLNVGISAQSETPLVYEWQLNNVPIDAMANPSAATDTFVIEARDPMDPIAQPGAQWSDAGSYRVRVTNATGISVITKPVTVKVNSAAVLLSDLPDEFFIATKAKGKLSVRAGGTPKLFYQWSIDGEGNVAKGGTGSSISISGTPENDGKVYRVSVRNAATDDEHPAAVSNGTTIRVINKLVSPLVTAALGMDTYEQKATFDKGTAPMLEVGASLIGTGTLEYQWQKDGRNMTDSATVTGTDERQLVFSDLAWGDRGVYRCIVRNEVSVVTSKTFVLGVNSPPVILTEPAANTTAITGGKAVLAMIAGGSGKLTYQWFLKNPNPMEDDTPLSKATTNKLTLSKLLRNVDVSGDDYYCQVRNEFTDTLGGGTPTQSADANVLVYDPVKIVTHPAKDDVRVGNNFTANVGVTGDDPIIYEWYLNKKVRLVDGPLGSATISGATTATLQISNLQAAQQGSYTCIVRNALVPGTSKYLANVTSKPAKLVVVIPPSIAQETSVSPASPVTEEESATLSVLGAGTGPLKYQWQRSDDFGANWTPLTGKTLNKLVFPKIQLNDDAWYRCEVNNILNEPAYSLPLELKVNLIPGATITDFYPVVGVAGDKVRVIGTEMQYVTSAKFGTVSAAVVVESDTSVLLTVPNTLALNSPVKIKLQTKNFPTDSTSDFRRLALPGNDSPSEGTILIGRQVSHLGTNIDFETSTGFPDPTAQSTAWFWWRAPTTERYRISVDADFDSVFAYGTGSPAAQTYPSPQFRNNPGISGEGVQFNAVQDTDYFIVVAGTESLFQLANGNFSLQIASDTPLPPPDGENAVVAPPSDTALPPAFAYRLGGTNPESAEAQTLTGLRPDPADEGDEITAHFTLSLEVPAQGGSGDGFGWTLYGTDEAPLAGVWIQASDGSVSVTDASGSYRPCSLTLHPDTPYHVEFWINRDSGVWSARIDGAPLGEPVALPAGAEFLELAPVWKPSTDGAPHATMNFYDLRINVD